MSLNLLSRLRVSSSDLPILIGLFRRFWPLALRCCCCCCCPTGLDIDLSDEDEDGVDELEVALFSPFGEDDVLIGVMRPFLDELDDDCKKL